MDQHKGSCPVAGRWMTLGPVGFLAEGPKMAKSAGTKLWAGAAILVLALAQAGAADSLRDKIKKGAGKAADAVGNTADKVGDSVDSAVDLAINDDPPDVARAKLDDMASSALNRLLAESPEARGLYVEGAGHAVFDTRRVATLGVAAGFGRGVAVSKSDLRPVYMKMATGGVGASLGIGGFETQMVILFETAADFTEFIEKGYDATAEAGSMFGDDKATEGVRYVDGRSFFMLSDKGWKVSASASGIKFWPDPKLN